MRPLRSTVCALALVFGAGASSCARTAKPGTAHGRAPRPVLHAVPEDADAVLYAPTLRDGLAGAVDFLERAASGLVSSGLFDREPFFRYAQASSSDSARALGVDPEEGLAVFALPGQPGTMVAVGAHDEAAALAGAARLFEEAGFATRPLEGGGLAFESAEGRESFAFTDRGYLYLASTWEADGPGPDAHAVRQRIRAGPEEGLSTSPGLAGLLQRVPGGPLFLFAPRWGGEPARPLLASFRFFPDAMEVEGAVGGEGPLWEDSHRAPLTSAPSGPVVAASLSLSPRLLAQLAAHVLGRREDQALLERALRGDASVTAYFDARGTVREMRDGADGPDVQGAVYVRAGVRDRGAAEVAVQQLLRSADASFQRKPAQDATAFVGEYRGRPLDVEVTADRLSAVVGTPLRDREDAAVGQELAARLGGGAFGPGHASAVVDVGQLSRELGQHPPGEDQASEALMAFVSSFIQQATAIDAVWVDVQPASSGASLRAKVMVRPR